MNIKAKQVARAISDMREERNTWHVITDALGAGWWGVTPKDVFHAWDRGEWDACLKALSRWHSELVGAEQPSPIFNVGDLVRVIPMGANYVLTDVRTSEDGVVFYKHMTGANAYWWPEHQLRLVSASVSRDVDGEAIRILVERATRAERERDEAKAALATAVALYARDRLEEQHGFDPVDPDTLGTLDRPRPEPTFKVGDWVRVVTGPLSANYKEPMRITGITPSGFYFSDSMDATWAEEQLVPALDPALHVMSSNESTRSTNMPDIARQLVEHPRWTWQPGMRYTRKEHAFRAPANCEGVLFDPECVPDTADPATKGWLLHMLLAVSKHVHFDPAASGLEIYVEWCDIDGTTCWEWYSGEGAIAAAWLCGVQREPGH